MSDKGVYHPINIHKRTSELEHNGCSHSSIHNLVDYAGVKDHDQIRFLGEMWDRREGFNRDFPTENIKEWELNVHQGLAARTLREKYGLKLMNNTWSSRGKDGTMTNERLNEILGSLRKAPLMVHRKNHYSSLIGHDPQQKIVYLVDKGEVSDMPVAKFKKLYDGRYLGVLKNDKRT